MNKPSAINRIEEFESLRGLMALWVLFGHVALTFEIAAFDRLWWWRLGEGPQSPLLGDGTDRRPGSVVCNIILLVGVD